MRMPQTPPDVKASILSDPHLLERLLPALRAQHKEYYHWDKLRHLKPPEGLTNAEWWTAIKLGRMNNGRKLGLTDRKGKPFEFRVRDELTESLHHIDLKAGGRIQMLEPVTNPQTRDQYLVSSLIHEAITSSQLEGAVTTRAVAKEMIRSGRPPTDRSERMILNNYRTMAMIIDLKDRPLSPALVFEIHTRITEGTLAHDDAAGRLRRADELVTVEDDNGEIIHMPPDALQLEKRMELMCRFANGDDPKFFVHPVVRAIILHFWLAYDHPFVDGNGRTSRALFYWAMLRHDYWLFEFISISDILTRAPTDYYRAFCYSETDDNDLTYFLVHQMGVIEKALLSLHEYIQRKSAEVSESEKLLRGWGNLNHRQVALISHALRHPHSLYTVEGHQQSHKVVYETARTDLLKLATAGLLISMRKGKGKGVKDIYSPPADLARKLKERIA